MKRVLIISYYWPPSGGAGVQRWLKFSKYLPDYSWKPVVYTPENPEAPIDDPSLLKDIHPEAEVLRTPIWEPYQFYKKFLGMSTGERINAGFLTEKSKPGKKEKLSVWIRGNLFIPDARKFWIKPSVKILKKYLNDHPVDALISTGPPHSMHLIAHKLHKHTGIPWLADFRDPWTGIDFYDQLLLTKRSDRKHRRLEKMILQDASKVVVIGKSMAREFKEIAGIDARIVNNGFDSEDFGKEEIQKSENFTIVHIGAMNKDRNHDAFWKAISAIKQENSNGFIKLKLIGKLDVSVLNAIKEHKLEDITEIVAYLSHELIPAELKSASLLYLPINNTPNARAVQTGKIFEYLASGKAILGIGPEDGDAAAILDETKAGIMIDFHKVDEIKSAILKYREDYRLEKKPLTENIGRYSRKNLCGMIAGILDEISVVDGSQKA